VLREGMDTSVEIPDAIMALLDQSSATKPENLKPFTTARDILKRLHEKR